MSNSNRVTTWLMKYGVLVGLFILLFGFAFVSTEYPFATEHHHHFRSSQYFIHYVCGGDMDFLHWGSRR